MRAELPFGAELRSALGTPGTARTLYSSPGSRVWRVELSGKACQRDVVVKQFVGGPGARKRFDREVCALRIAGRARPPVVPELLGTDPARLVLVLEHLEHRKPPADWPVGYATALATMHATARPADARSLPRWTGPTEVDARAFLSLASALGIGVTTADADELDALVHRLRAAPASALLHGDPCPGNDLYLDNSIANIPSAKGNPPDTRIRFVDFEQASLGDGLVELAYLRIGFPSCGYAIAPATAQVEQAELAYGETWSAATGARFGDDVAARITDACAGWLIRGDALVQRAQRDGTDRLAMVLRADWDWGPMSARQRLAHRLGVVAESTGERGDLAGLHRISGGMRRRMIERWPVLEPLPTARVLL